MLPPEQEKRYGRQILLPTIGPEGQARLGRSRVAVVGCGGLGSVLSQLMVRMGVGRVTVIDGDRPDATNLHRQLLYDETDVAAGLPKAQTAAALPESTELSGYDTCSIGSHLPVCSASAATKRLNQIGRAHV
jgi:molybdopterin/thiamine biosynthesis adenylyltransferase